MTAVYTFAVSDFTKHDFIFYYVQLSSMKIVFLILVIFNTVWALSIFSKLINPARPSLAIVQLKISRYAKQI